MLSSINRDTPSKMPRKINACCSVISPFARGLDFVRSTWESRSLSHMSLIMHPADRIKIAPKKKSPAIFIVSKVTSLARKIDHNDGNSKSHIPIGRSIRVIYKKGRIFEGSRSIQGNFLISV